MFAWRFKRLISTLQFRVEQEGRKDPAWVLGFVEGLGKRTLTGYQAGAVIHLLLCGELQPNMPDSRFSERKEVE